MRPTSLRAGVLSAALVATLVATPLTHAQQTLPYDPEQPVPVGYRVEERPRVGLIVSGSVLTGFAVGFLAYGFARRGEERAQADALSKNDPTYEGTPGASSSTISFVFGGLFAAVGLPLLLVGVTTKKKVLVAEPEVGFAPLIGKGFGGIGVGGTF